MSEDLYNILKDFPGKEHVEKTCKPGDNGETCRYLVIGSKGFECGKTGGIRSVINKRFTEGTMRAKGDNCGGLLGIIIENQEALNSKKAQYKESMPAYEVNGVVRELFIEDGVLQIIGDWDDAEEGINPTVPIDSLEISVDQSGITLGVAGLGAFAGKTTIFF